MFFNYYNAVVFKRGALQNTALNNSLGSASRGFRRGWMNLHGSRQLMHMPCSAALRKPKTPISSLPFLGSKIVSGILRGMQKTGKEQNQENEGIWQFQKRERPTSSVGCYRAWAKRPGRWPDGHWWLPEVPSVRTVIRAEPGGWTEEEMGIWAMWGQEFEGETR